MGKDKRQFHAKEVWYAEQLAYLRKNLPLEEQFVQLAEECNELAQACMKIVRFFGKVNPPRKTEEELKEALREELADVFVCASVLTDTVDMKTVFEKVDRWYNVVKKTVGEKEE